MCCLRVEKLETGRCEWGDSLLTGIPQNTSSCPNTSAHTSQVCHFMKTPHSISTQLRFSACALSSHRRITEHLKPAIPPAHVHTQYDSIWSSICTTNTQLSSNTVCTVVVQQRAPPCGKPWVCCTNNTEDLTGETISCIKNNVGSLNQTFESVKGEKYT